MVEEKLIVVLIIIAIVISVVSIAVTLSVINTNLIPDSQQKVNINRVMGNNVDVGKGQLSLSIGEASK